MAVFDDVRYWLSESLPPERQDIQRNYLDSNGAQAVDSIEDATHIITNSEQFEGWKRVEDGDINAAVVTVCVRGRRSYVCGRSFFLLGAMGVSIDGSGESPTVRIYNQLTLRTHLTISYLQTTILFCQSSFSVFRRRSLCC